MTTLRTVWTFDWIKRYLTEACAFAEKKGLTIKPHNFGIHLTERGGELDGSGCLCPIGALELFLKKPRQAFNFNYDPFVDGFDSEIEPFEVEEQAKAWTEKDPVYGELYRLGRDFRKQYVKEAA